MTSLYEISEYKSKTGSTASFVVRGDTKNIKEELKKLGGKYNANLTGGAGWIFSKKKEQSVREFLNKNSTTSPTMIPMSYSTAIDKSLTMSPLETSIPSYIQELINRIEKLEGDVSELREKNQVERDSLGELD